MREFDINRILVPVDFSPASINALNTAVTMANRHGGAILLLNVVDANDTTDFSAESFAGKVAIDAIVQNSEQQLQELQDSITERFLISCEAISKTGEVSSTIVNAVIDHRADIIVMGSNGALGVKEFLVGSTAYNVVKNASCPVLTVPSEKKWESFKKILFPVRPIPFALEKYDFVRKIIRKNEASLKILGLATDYERDVDLLKELACQLNEKLKEDEVEASTYFKVGMNMAEEVLKIAGLMEADMIVITATIESSLKQFFMGPYTQYIINHSRYPVLSIRPTVSNAEDEEAFYQNAEAFAQETPLYN